MSGKPRGLEDAEGTPPGHGVSNGRAALGNDGGMQKENSVALFSVNDEDSREFSVELDVFSGPFSVLLSLIAKKRLDITEVALGEVTDEFIAFLRAQKDFDLSQASEFLVVGATLLDMKAARLLPREEAYEEDFELLEQRDLLFAKLLQYRAFRDVSVDMARRLEEQSRFYAREAAVEEEFLQAIPHTELHLGVADLALLASLAFSRDKRPEVGLTHMHNPLVPVSSQIEVIRERLVEGACFTFASLCADAPSVATVVSRFLAVLELLRSAEIEVEQDESLGTLTLKAAYKIDSGEDSVSSSDESG